ncbi:conserved protein of unknown function [Bradyrhizobium sp. ORS 285]|uniref:hypothetical protein n=1 Tax=Bradyrhizobium sp. ORS 285 TaxID=115808 RepID=UPI0002408957|nr:hypothetical protein [Bradyrhizobium sp. ORS 285]CCD85077.1 conserved hypothetical protein [Bradyrhizobium sp. ORS 285]SMX58481.1 conserved protein of unknown function [Bradyrhizobium sp. ORS 285]
MTTLLDKAFDVARQLPAEEQDELARVLLRLTGHDEAHVELTQADLASLAGSLREADRRQFATDDHINAIWARHGL